MFKKVFILVVIISLTVVALTPRTAHGYEWIGHEEFNSSSHKTYMHIASKNCGERHQMLKVSVTTEKFFTRINSKCDSMKVEIYKLSETQTFEEVSGTFSSGTCELIFTIDCDNVCESLLKGNYILKIITYNKGKNDDVSSIIFGPPIPM
jgi:hypothetical protein